jgi:hypothetical protein
MSSKISNISSMAQSIYALKRDVYKNKPVEFAGGLTLNHSIRHSKPMWKE